MKAFIDTQAPSFIKIAIEDDEGQRFGHAIVAVNNLKRYPSAQTKAELEEKVFVSFDVYATGKDRDLEWEAFKTTYIEGGFGK